VTSTPGWEQLLDRSGHLDIAMWGSTLSVLTAMVVWLLLAGRARAENLARSMTADIERLAMVAKRTSNAVVFTDLQRRITWVNEGFSRITGYSFDEAIGRVPGELLQSDLSDPKVIRAIGQDLQALRTARHTILNRHKRGTDYWLDLEIQPMLGPDGEVRGFMAVESDVTVLVEGQMALKRERDRVTTILEGTNVGTWEWNFQTGAAIFNARWAEIVGYTLEELAPLDASTWERLCHPDDLAASNERLKDHFEKRAKFYDAEVRMRHKDDHWVWVLTRGRVATWSTEGQPLTLSGIHLDITERKHAEQSLAEATALLQNVLDSAVDVGISSTGLDRVIRVFNQGAQNLLGYTAEELVGKKTSSLFIDLTELGLISESLELTLGRRPTAQDVYNYVTDIRERQEWTLVRKDGSRFKANVQVSPMYDAEGALSGHLAVFYDVSKQKEFEASLHKAMILAEQSSVSKSQFLANMSHEIRTPMNAILGMLQLLESTGLSTRQEDYLDKAEGAARSLLGVLNDILDFSKVEAGKMQLSNEPFQVEALLSELSVILSSNLGKKDVDLVYDIDPRIPSELIGDALRLKQVLINLGGNAVKFTEHGEVVIQWTLLGRTTDRVKLRIAVSDSGIGIAQENQERIFEAFTQAEANTTRRFGGTGLGLVICTRLVRLMGGELELHSALGEGTTFSFRLELPLLELQAPPRSLVPLRVLIVDDNAAARAAVVAAGLGLGWQVSEARSGAEALEMTHMALANASQPWDAVLLDAHMPELDGPQTRHAMLQLTGGKAAPRFVLMSAHSRDSAAHGQGGESDRFDAQLVKPLTAGALARSVFAVPQQAQSEVLAATGSRLAGMQILLVEDNLINQQVAQELLTAEGAVVSVAENGLVGVNTVKTAKPQFDVVLMDMQMPVMDGLAATRLIRADGRFAQLPILAMTANAMASDRQACLAVGMNDHIGKPFDLQQLIATLVHHTGWSQVASATAASGHRQPLAPDTETWPEGLDIAAALARMGSNRDLLRRSILSFIGEASALSARVSEQLARGARVEVRREMHSFKGLSATLGVQGLSGLALQAEKAIEDTSPTSSFDSLMQQIAAQLEVVLPALQKVALQLSGGKTLMQEQSASPDLSPGAREQLDRLLQALRASDMDALELHAIFRDSAEAPLAECMQPLDAAMSDLEFERAAVECEKLIAQLTTR
jgi:PAS domain S-box-containing protein